MNADRSEILGAILTIAAGLFVAFYAGNRYAIGQLENMGPGFFPVVLGIVLIGLGLLLGVGAFMRPSAEPVFSDLPWRAILAIPAAVTVFALLFKTTGLIPGASVATLVASLANAEFRLLPTLVLSLFLSVFVWMVFVYLLQIQIPAFTFLG